jgi:subtilisin family serine protease
MPTEDAGPVDADDEGKGRTGEGADDPRADLHADELAADDRDDGDDDDGDLNPEAYDPRILDRSVIAIPLLRRIERAAEHKPRRPVPVVIDVNLNYPGGRPAATERTLELIETAVREAGDEGIQQGAGALARGGPYVVARLQPAVIKRLAVLDRSTGDHGPAIFHVWPDFVARALLDKSVSTVKADAVRASFAAHGEGITWAVLDTGVRRDHLHFREHGNLDVGPLEHKDFTRTTGPTSDKNGHGTHVAGIIAGHAVSTEKHPLRAVRYERDEDGNVSERAVPVSAISGVAPMTRIVSYKVLTDDGLGRTSDILTALDHIQKVNDHGRMIKIQGVNLSLGYDFDPEWFACGQSPLCVEIDRLVRSGVVVVVAAGNTGYAYAADAGQKRAIAAGRALTVNDPGNAELAITVGSTHRDMPHVYGVSYFSSKGPTGDGRAKPDLVAPGERILSAAAGEMEKAVSARRDGGGRVDYVESSGTSMAAPHVSGVIAAFLSIRREFIGRPERVKEIFTSTATDLGRVREFQGHGLVDAMRAIQSV